MKALAALAAAALVGGAAQRVGQAGVTVALPRGWSSIPLVLPPSTGDPATRIVVASAPISFGQCGDTSYVFTSRAVAIVVLEARGTPGRWAPRPRRFTAQNLPIRAPPAIECHAGPGGGIQFQDHSRRFEVFVLLGRRAPGALAARARAVLDTLRVR
ncbi:MAG: hypothetical protein ACYDA3_07860 [Gaiellaceae bacterium]